MLMEERCDVLYVVSGIGYVVGKFGLVMLLVRFTSNFSYGCCTL